MATDNGYQKSDGKLNKKDGKYIRAVPDDPCCCGAVYRQLYGCDGATTDFWCLESTLVELGGPPSFIWYDTGSDPLIPLFFAVSSASSTDPVGEGGTIVEPTDPTGHTTQSCCTSSCVSGGGGGNIAYIPQDAAYTADATINWLNPPPGYTGLTTASGTSVVFQACAWTGGLVVYGEEQGGMYVLNINPSATVFTIQFDSEVIGDDTAIAATSVPWPFPGKFDTGGTILFTDILTGYMYEVSCKVNGISCYVDYSITIDGTPVSPALWALLNP